MRDLADHTRVGPDGRLNHLVNFSRRLVSASKTMETLNGWKLQLGEELVEVPGRELPLEIITFGNGR